MSAAPCRHECRLEYGGFVLCFDCGFERHPGMSMLPVSLDARGRVQVGAAAVQSGADSVQSLTPAVLCKVCGARLMGLGDLIHHTCAPVAAEAAPGGSARAEGVSRGLVHG